MSRLDDAGANVATEVCGKYSSISHSFEMSSRPNLSCAFKMAAIEE